MPPRSKNRKKATASFQTQTKHPKPTATAAEPSPSAERDDITVAATDATTEEINLAGSGAAHQAPHYQPDQQYGLKPSKRKKRPINRRAGPGVGASMRRNERRSLKGRAPPPRPMDGDDHGLVEEQLPDYFRRDRTTGRVAAQTADRGSDWDGSSSVRDEGGAAGASKRAGDLCAVDTSGGEGLDV